MIDRFVKCECIFESSNAIQSTKEPPMVDLENALLCHWLRRSSLQNEMRGTAKKTYGLSNSDPSRQLVTPTDTIRRGNSKAPSCREFDPKEAAAESIRYAAS